MRWMHLKSWGFKMKVLVYGYGLMGKKIAHKVRSQNDMELMGIVSYEFDEKVPEKTYSSLKECDEKADVIIDFSHPNNLNDILTYALANQTKLVIATTGYSQEQLDQIKEASKEIAIFQSYTHHWGADGYKNVTTIRKKNFMTQDMILRSLKNIIIRKLMHLQELLNYYMKLWLRKLMA